MTESLSGTSTNLRYMYIFSPTTVHHYGNLTTNYHRKPWAHEEVIAISPTPFVGLQRGPVNHVASPSINDGLNGEKRKLCTPPSFSVFVENPTTRMLAREASSSSSVVCAVITRFRHDRTEIPKKYYFCAWGGWTPSLFFSPR